MQDFTFFTTENSEVPIFNSQFDPFNPNKLVANLPNDPIQTFNYPAIWPHWAYDNDAAPNLASDLWV